MTKSKLIQILLASFGVLSVGGGTGYLIYDHIKIQDKAEATVIKLLLEKLKAEVVELIPDPNNVPSKTLTLDVIISKIESIKTKIQDIESKKNIFKNYDDLVGNKIDEFSKIVKNIEEKISDAKSKINSKSKTT